MERKYEFTDETKHVGDHVLHRIRAVRGFVDVHPGDLGGWIECEENLSHGYNCWVSGEAQVYGKAVVLGDAQICGNARVHGNAWVGGGAQVCGNAWVGGNAHVYGDALVSGYAQVSGCAQVGGDASVRGEAIVHGDVQVLDKARVCGNARLEHQSDFVYIENSALPNGELTYTRSNREWEASRMHGTAKALLTAMRMKHYDERTIKCFETIADAVERMYGIMEAKEI